MENEKKWYQKLSNWLMIAICMILVPVLILNLFIMFQAKTNEDAIPSIFGYKPFIVLSGSMESKIRKGDLIITKIVKDPNTLEINDVIAFRDAENTVTTHRIIDKVIENGKVNFITKGDNNSSQDLNLVELEDVEGIYIGRVPGIGSMMNSLSDPTTILVIFVGISVVFALGFVISTKKQNEAERKEFLEYKRMKELEALQKTESESKSKSSELKENTANNSSKEKKGKK